MAIFHTMLFDVADSPGVPPSATAHELFRGFSYVAPVLMDDNSSAAPLDNHNLVRVSTQFRDTSVQ